MTFEDFLRRVASEPNRSEERDVDIPSPELIRDIERRGGILVTDLLADARKTRERRVFHYGHLLGPGLREYRKFKRHFRDAYGPPLPLCSA